MKKIIKWILVIIWMIVIFMFSNENSDLSSNRSSGLIRSTVVIVDNILNLDMSDEDIDKFVEDNHYIVRKLAHFSIYFILGTLVISCFSEYNLSLNKLIIYSILFCFSYSLFDECNQLFISGRSGNFIDCIIDTCGSITSIILYRFCCKFIKKKL